MKYQILQCFFLILYSPNSVTSFNCSRNSKEMCLTDCSWSTEENKCKDCPPGFYGIKCLSLCRYPNYGDNCQQDCSNCSEQQCDSVFGCLTGHMRQNALYVGSVVAEHCVSTDIYRPEPTSSDSYNDIYSVVNTIRRPNVSNLAFRKKENEWN
uniref:Multiple epidermal growth factor-like domains protein 6 isoform X4 n=1 Tax=Crassostrea virginica TaxID=6565 RepID=A0A8B8AXZ8_CRAVI|nr:multiple epidermal growth factor-like domains protein 6 isoform X4 [Crassostrea virginica]